MKPNSRPRLPAVRSFLTMTSFAFVSVALYACAGGSRPAAPVPAVSPGSPAPIDAGTTPAQPCRIAADEAAWLQRALDDWDRASRIHLRLPPAPAPWIVAFDTTCAWHLAPDTTRLTAASPIDAGLRLGERPVPVSSVRHGGTVVLPSGARIPLAPRMNAALAEELDRPYFVLALPSVFRLNPAAAADPLLEQRLQSVVSHEILHTHQLADLRRHLDALEATYGALPDDLDDDVIEATFAGDSAFRTAFEAERDLFYRAVFEPDSGRARELARRALAVLGARRARHFTGDAAIHARLEDLFLNMEGVAEWVRFRLHQDAGEIGGPAAIAAFIRGPNNDWVQDEGLALILLLERFADDWQSSLLGPGMASPVAELERALRDAAPADG